MSSILIKAIGVWCQADSSYGLAGLQPTNFSATTRGLIMKHDWDYINREIAILKRHKTFDDNAGGHVSILLRDYHEHQDRWLTTDELPESDTFVTPLCKDEFNGMSDHPITAHYCKGRNLFAENGEEIPHGAVRFYKVVTMPESGA